MNINGFNSTTFIICTYVIFICYLRYYIAYSIPSHHSSGCWVPLCYHLSALSNAVNILQYVTRLKCVNSTGSIWITHITFECVLVPVPNVQVKCVCLSWLVKSPSRRRNVVCSTEVSDTFRLLTRPLSMFVRRIKSTEVNRNMTKAMSFCRPGSVLDTITIIHTTYNITLKRKHSTASKQNNKQSPFVVWRRRVVSTVHPFDRSIIPCRPASIHAFVVNVWDSWA